MKVLVTRPRERATDLCARLEAAELEPVCLPVIETQPLEDLAPLDAALAHLATYDWLIFASPEAARLFGTRAAALGVPAAAHAARGRPRIVAGPATAQALARDGIPAQVVSPFSAERVLAAIAPLVRARQRVLLPRGDRGLPTLADGLRTHGLTVDEVVLYRTVDAQSGSTETLRSIAEHGLAAVTFFSPSAVAGLEAALRAALPPEAITHLKANAVAAGIGPTTAAAARSAGWGTVVAPPDTSASALVSSLAAHLASAGTDPTPDGSAAVARGLVPRNARRGGPQGPALRPPLAASEATPC